MKQGKEYYKWLLRRHCSASMVQRECSTMILVLHLFSSNALGLTATTPERNPSLHFIIKDTEAERDNGLQWQEFAALPSLSLPFSWASHGISINDSFWTHSRLRYFPEVGFAVQNEGSPRQTEWLSSLNPHSWISVLFYLYFSPAEGTSHWLYLLSQCNPCFARCSFARISGTLLHYILILSLDLAGPHLSSHFFSGCLSKRQRWLSSPAWQCLIRFRNHRPGSLIFLQLCQEVSDGLSRQLSAPLILIITSPIGFGTLDT